MMLSIKDYKLLKGKNNLSLGLWLTAYRDALFHDGVQDTMASVFLTLADNFQFKDDALGQVRRKAQVKANMPRIIVSKERGNMVRSFSRERMTEWLDEKGQEAYFNGREEVLKSVSAFLQKEYDFTEKDIRYLESRCKFNVDAINERYITAEEITQGLVKEGMQSIGKWPGRSL